MAINSSNAANTGLEGILNRKKKSSFAATLLEHRNQAFTANPHDIFEKLKEQYPDPYIFIRELVQNSNDAGSSIINVETGYDSERKLMSITVDDDGHGMNNKDREDFLLRLFSSNKEGVKGNAGRIGIGFTSIFALEPDYVIVDSSKDGERWNLFINKDIEKSVKQLSELSKGTSVTILKEGVDDGAALSAESRINNYLRHWCRYVKTPILLNGECINEKFDLNSDFKIGFKGDGIEGIVTKIQGYGNTKLFSHYILLEDSQTINFSYEFQNGLDRAWEIIVNNDGFEPNFSRNAASRDNGEVAKVMSAVSKAYDLFLLAQLNSIDPDNKVRIKVLDPDLLDYEIMNGKNVIPVENFAKKFDKEFLKKFLKNKKRGVNSQLRCSYKPQTFVQERNGSISALTSKGSMECKDNDIPIKSDVSGRFTIKEQAFDSFTENGCPLYTLTERYRFDGANASESDHAMQLVYKFESDEEEKETLLPLPPGYNVDLSTLTVRCEDLEGKVSDQLASSWIDGCSNVFLKFKKGIKKAEIHYKAAPVKTVFRENHLEEMKEHYTKLPFELKLPEEVRKFLDEIRGFQNPEKAKMVEQFLKNYIEYRGDDETTFGFLEFHAGRTPEKNLIEYILNSKKADCDTSNMPLVAILRYLGIPARLGIGYSVTENSMDGHGFTEAYFPETGWVMLDSTARPRRSKLSIDDELAVDPKNPNTIKLFEDMVNSLFKRLKEDAKSPFDISEKGSEILKRYTSKFDKAYEEKYLKRDYELTDKNWAMVESLLGNIIRKENLTNAEGEAIYRKIFRDPLHYTVSLAEIIEKANEKHKVIILSKDQLIGPKMADVGYSVVDNENNHVYNIMRMVSGCKVVDVDSECMIEPDIVDASSQSPAHQKLVDSMNEFIDKNNEYKDVFGKVYLANFSGEEYSDNIVVRDYHNNKKVIDSLREIRGRKKDFPKNYTALNIRGNYVHELAEISLYDKNSATINAFNLALEGLNLCAPDKDKILQSIAYKLMGDTA